MRAFQFALAVAAAIALGVWLSAPAAAAVPLTQAVVDGVVQTCLVTLANGGTCSGAVVVVGSEIRPAGDVWAGGSVHDLTVGGGYASAIAELNGQCELREAWGK